MMLLYVGITFAQAPKKEAVKFAKGETSAAVTRSLNAGASLEFSIHAKAGQTMDYSIGYDFNNRDLAAFFTEAGTQDKIEIEPKKPSNETVLSNSGNHRILVKNKSRKKITFTLYLSIE